MKKKPRTFENSFNFIQKILIAKYLIDNEIENVKHIFNAYKVPYSEQLAEDIKTKYAQQFTKKITNKVFIETMGVIPMQ